MTIPRITSLLIMLTLGRDAMALQLGQISSQSSRGQLLSARITLYGAAPLQSDAVAVEIMSEFGAPQDTLAKLGVHAEYLSNGRDDHYIAITSSAAIDQAQLALRVRLKEGALALVRRYSLTLTAAPVPRLVRTVSKSLPASNVPTITTALNGSYGPVRAGQSLWRILQEMGLARGETGTLMKTIVAANPSAFVGGDPTRLRVGVMLRLPDTTGIAKATPAIVASSALLTTDNTNKIAGDPALAARLDRLGRRFALIRARYADQQKPTVNNSDISQPTVARDHGSTATARVTQSTAATSLTLNKTSSLTTSQAPPPGPASIIKSKTGSQPRASSITNDKPTPRGDYADGRTLMLLGGGALGMALITLALHLARRLRGIRADAGVRSADRDLVAEIARKTEKRVQLEGEVKRMIAGRRAAAEDSMSSGLRPADLLGGGHTSLEEIETHIAHGRYDTAEGMLEQVIAAGPNNHRAKLRLAEIYYLNERHEEFVALVEEIHRRHRGDIGDDNWARLMRMGKIIVPARPPFSGPLAVKVERQAG